MSSGPIGSYAGARLSPAGRLIKLPDTVGFDDASALLFKGLTAQYLLRAHIPCARGVLLLYGAGGAVGQIIASWASHLGGAVIGIVSRETSNRASARGWLLPCAGLGSMRHRRRG
jgi:NADPH:quinone reductase